MKRALVTIFLTRAAIFIMLLAAKSVSGQIIEQDSLRMHMDEQVLFLIGKTRVERWLDANGNSRKDTAESIREILKDAETFARESDFVTANIFLEAAKELISSEHSKQWPSLPEGRKGSEQGHISEKKWQWTPRLYSGVDIFRHTFELSGIEGEEETIYESSGEPFAGMSVSAAHQSEKYGSSQIFADGRLARIYFNAQLRAQHLYGQFRSNHLFFENRSELARYGEGFGLNYSENTTRLRAGKSLWQEISIFAGNDLRFRRYTVPDNLFKNYRHHNAYAGLQYLSGLATRIYATYLYGQRKHVELAYNTYNYTESRLDLGIYQLMNINSSIAFENSYKIRKYPLGLPGTLQASYNEEFFRADFRLGLSNIISFDLQGEALLRQYHQNSTVMPDFLELKANPRFLVNFWRDLHAGLGYLYKLGVHDYDIIKTRGTGTIATNADLQLIEYEDYFSHGLSISLELFRAGAFMLSLNNSIEFRTFPNALDQNLPGLTHYMNRRLNSLFLYLSWKISGNLELSTLANIDGDKSRIERHDDFRYGLFSFDLGWTF